MQTLVCHLIIIHTELPDAFMDEVEVYIKKLWAASQLDLEKKHTHSKDTRNRVDVSPYELLVYSSAACIDLLFWSVREESGSYIRYMFEKKILLILFLNQYLKQQYCPDRKCIFLVLYSHLVMFYIKF